MNGGFICVDCTGLDLTKGSTQQTVNGLYARLQTAIASGKKVVAYNCNWNNIYCTPFEVLVIQLEANLITATASTLQVRVTNADKVTILNMAPSE